MKNNMCLPTTPHSSLESACTQHLNGPFFLSTLPLLSMPTCIVNCAIQEGKQARKNMKEEGKNWKMNYSKCYVSYRSQMGGVPTDGNLENVRRNGSKSGWDSCGDLAACMRPSSINSYSSRSLGGHRNFPGVCVPPQPPYGVTVLKETRCLAVGGSVCLYTLCLSLTLLPSVCLSLLSHKLLSLSLSLCLSSISPSASLPSLHSTHINKAGSHRNECNQRKEKRTRVKEKGETLRGPLAGLDETLNPKPKP